MKKKEFIQYRDIDKASPFYPAGEIIYLPGIGDFPAVLHAIGEEDEEAIFKLAAVTADFIYYGNEEEFDDDANVVMLNRDMQVVSDNFHASNDLMGVLEDNEEILWLSDAAKEQQDYLKEDDND